MKIFKSLLLILACNIIVAEPISCHGVSNFPIQSTIAHTGAVLATRASAAIVLRKQAGSTCKILTNEKFTELRTSIVSAYEELWRTAWLGIPSTIDFENPDCVCSSVDVGQSVKTILKNMTIIANRINVILPESCQKKVRNSKLRNTIKNYRAVNTRHIETVRNLVSTLPSSAFSCQ